MENSNHNVKFSYLYRDGANYKQWDEVIFTNKTGISFNIIEARINDSLIDGEWFDARKWQLKDLHFTEWDNEIDVLFHEFDSVEETEELATGQDISDFLVVVRSAKVPC